MVFVEDIGTAGAAAFIQPEKFIGQTVNLAGDEISMPEAGAIISKVLGKTIGFQTLPKDQAMAAMGPDFTMMFKWFDDVGYNVDIQGLEKRYGIPPTSFAAAAPKMKWPEA